MSSSQSDATDTVTSPTATEPAVASSRAGSRQTPPPGTPPTPMTSQEGNSKPRGHAASGEDRRKGRKKLNMEVFDKVYYKKGKVQVFPDFVESKVTLYKRVIPARPPPPAGAVRDAQGSREQTTPSTATEISTGQSSKVSTDRQQQGDQKMATGSAESLGGTLQDKNAAEETQSLSSKRNIEASSGGKDGDSGDQTKPKKIRINEPPSYALDEDKLRNPKIVEHLESEDWEFLVVQLVKAALEESMGPDDPPVFLFHNQDLSSKAGNSKSGEKDILVLHPHLGVLLLEVKAVKNKDAFSRFDEATAQLLHAKESVLKEMGDLLEKDAVVLTIALPKLEPEDSSIVRQKAEERLSAKPGSDVTAATSSFSVTSSTAGKREGSRGRKSGRAGGNRDPKLKEGASLGNHPEIHLVCGPTAEIFTQWLTRLQHLRATTSHAFKGCTPQERLENFKTACLRRCSVAGLRPGQSVKDSSDRHHRFLLTEEQLRVRDSQAELLHISGPCGSGKTLLLAERARRWLREGRRVALMVGELYFHNVLLRHLVDSVCGEKKSVAGVSTHRGYKELLQWLDTLSTEDPPISIIVDEALFGSTASSYYSRLLHHVRAGRVRGLWTAYTGRLEDKAARELERLGGSTVHLSHCLRCPPHVRAWADSLRWEGEPPMLPPPVPVTRELGEGVQVIRHPDHPQRQSWHTCTRCEEEVTAFFSSLGLPGDGATSALKLSDVVVITTGWCDRERVARWLRGLGLHAVAEEGTVMYTNPVLPPGATPTSRDHAEEEAYRQRVLKGNDVTGKPAVHVVWCPDFQGLEKPVVLLWHEDWDDEDRDRQGQWYREGRMALHRHSWFQVASRCQGRLLVMAATPSPLLPLLPATSPPRRQDATCTGESKDFSRSWRKLAPGVREQASMPTGRMSHCVHDDIQLPGHEGFGVIVIDYVIPDGTQGPEHPQPGSPYSGCVERAFLPDTGQGRHVLTLLEEAFDRRLTFQMCVQPGGQALVEWADIPHKTCLRGPRDRGGYPDCDYLATVQDVLRDKYGIE